MTCKMIEYYNRVRDQERLISHLVLNGGPEYAFHPEPCVNVDRITNAVTKVCEACYITSVDNFDKNVTAGAVCGAPLRLAAECIVNGTHRLALPEEVASWKLRQLDNKKAADLAEASNSRGGRGAFSVTLPSPEPGVKK
jgi:hypothetical protein